MNYNYFFNSRVCVYVINKISFSLKKNSGTEKSLKELFSRARKIALEGKPWLYRY